MEDNNPSNVSSAFEMLLEELDAEVDVMSGLGAKAFASRDFARVDQARQRAEVLLAFREKVAELCREWEALSIDDEDEQTRSDRRNLGRLRRGLRTPNAEFVLPILRSLEEMGGSGNVQDVLERVFTIMEPRLRDVDLDPIPSDSRIPRWRNAAQWVRNTMRRQGLIVAGSPRGIWEISDAGRDYLRRHS